VLAVDPDAVRSDVDVAADGAALDAVVLSVDGVGDGAAVARAERGLCGGHVPVLTCRFLLAPRSFALHRRNLFLGLRHPAANVLSAAVGLSGAGAVTGTGVVENDSDLHVDMAAAGRDVHDVGVVRRSTLDTGTCHVPVLSRVSG
jgi:hypothetical protein